MTTYTPFAKAFTLFVPMALLAACGQDTAPNENQAVDDFAARINNGGNAANGEASNPVDPNAKPQVYTPPEGVAPGPFQAGTGSDPAAASCGAPKVAPFYGRKADQLTRDAVMAAVAPQKDVRFLQPGSNLMPDPKSKRLNIMLDITGVIRDARCG